MNKNRYVSRVDAMIIAVRNAQAAIDDMSRDLDAARIEVGTVRPRTQYFIDEAAQTLGLSRSTVRRRLIDGTFSSAKIGGRRLIPAEDLEQLGHDKGARTAEGH